MSFLPAPLPALERSLKVTNISNDLLPMGRLTHLTPFHRNKGGLAAFQEDRGEQKLDSPAESHAPPGLQPFPLSLKGIYSANFSPPRECQNCDLHGKAAKAGTIQGWWAHLGH